MPPHIPRIIGLLARSRSGKDTVADYIISLNPSVVKHRLAQPVKDAVCALYGFTTDQVEGPEKEVIDTQVGISPRDAMVAMTTSTMELMGTTFFSRRLFDAFDSGSLGRHIVVPDVRYEHDIFEIRRRGGLVIKIERDCGLATKHAWEDCIDDMEGDVTIKNDGTVACLHRQVDAALTSASATAFASASIEPYVAVGMRHGC